MEKYITIKLIGKREDKAKTFFWIITNGDSASHTKNHVRIKESLYNQLKKTDCKFKRVR